MGRKTEIERDQDRWFELVKEMQKMSWNVAPLDEALAMAWKYMQRTKMRECEIEHMRKINRTEKEKRC